LRLHPKNLIAKKGKIPYVCSLNFKKRVDLHWLHLLSVIKGGFRFRLNACLYKYKKLRQILFSLFILSAIACFPFFTEAVSDSIHQMMESFFLIAAIV
jgi:hypothetical protein